MEKGTYVYHVNNPSELLVVQSPASSNGGKEIICVTPENRIENYIIHDKPEFFRPVIIRDIAKKLM